MSCTSCQNITIETFNANSPDISRWENQWQEKKETGCPNKQTSKCLYNAQGEFICDKTIPGVTNEYMVQRPLYEKNIAQYASKT